MTTCCNCGISFFVCFRAIFFHRNQPATFGESQAGIPDAFKNAEQSDIESDSRILQPTICNIQVTRRLNHRLKFDSLKSALKSLCSYKILAVDDEFSVRMAIQMLLKHDGHEVQMADSGEAALAMLEQGKFALLITDYSMQGMKGTQLAILVKQRYPGQPIIMVTAFADEFTTYGKSPEGVDFVISKPFSQKELREAVARVLP
jgi:two-component system, cell cycle response regulator CpdR